MNAKLRRVLGEDRGVDTLMEAASQRPSATLRQLVDQHGLPLVGAAAPWPDWYDGWRSEIQQHISTAIEQSQLPMQAPAVDVSRFEISATYVERVVDMGLLSPELVSELLLAGVNIEIRARSADQAYYSVEGNNRVTTITGSVECWQVNGVTTKAQCLMFTSFEDACRYAMQALLAGDPETTNVYLHCAQMT